MLRHLTSLSEHNKNERKTEQENRRPKLKNLACGLLNTKSPTTYKTYDKQVVRNPKLANIHY